MSFVQLVGAFRLYGADVLVIALGVMLATFLLKKTVMKASPPRVFPLLTFSLGTVLYAVYRVAAEGSAAPLTGELAQTLEGGLSCGCASALFFALIKQLSSAKRSENPLLPLLDFVPEARRQEAADALLAGAEGLDEEGMRRYFEDNLNTFADPPMSETELLAAACVLAEYLTSIGKV